MARWAQSFYEIKNPDKYVGKHKPYYRSGWELSFMIFCDSHDKVIKWASEAIKIPYKNPFTGKGTVYVPDFFVLYEDKNGRQIAEIIEIKPKKQSIIESKVTNARNRAVVALNHVKWAAAKAYCKQQGFTFRVITEDDLFYNSKSK